MCIRDSYKNIHGTYIDQCPPATIKAQPKNAVSWLVDTLMAVSYTHLQGAFCLA